MTGGTNDEVVKVGTKDEFFEGLRHDVEGFLADREAREKRMEEFFEREAKTWEEIMRDGPEYYMEHYDMKKIIEWRLDYDMGGDGKQRKMAISVGEREREREINNFLFELGLKV